MQRLLILLLLLVSAKVQAQVAWAHHLYYIQQHVLDHEGNIIAIGTLKGELAAGNGLINSGDTPYPHHL